MSRAVLDADKTGFARRGDGAPISWGVDSTGSRRALNKAYLARLQLREGEVTVVDISSASNGRYQGRILLLGPGAGVPGEELPEGAKVVFDEEHVFSAEMLVDHSPTRHAGVRALSYIYRGHYGTGRATKLGRARFVAWCASAAGGGSVVLGVVIHSITGRAYLPIALCAVGVVAFAVGATVRRGIAHRIRQGRR